MSDPYVLLTRATHSLQSSLIEQILEAEGIPFECVDHTLSVILGSNAPMGHQEFLVSPERLQEAKDALCAGGVMCEVSHRLLTRTLKEVIEPLIHSESSDYERLVRLIEINNKETVHALFERTLELEHGRELLEDLFFELVRTSSSGLLPLARALRNDATADFLRSCQTVAIFGDKQSRMALVELLPEIPSSELHREVLAVALTDSDYDLRDAASEALFSLTESDCGFDPGGSPEERTEVVERILDTHFQPVPGGG